MINGLGNFTKTSTGSLKGTLTGSLTGTWIGSSAGSSTRTLMRKGEAQMMARGKGLGEIGAERRDMRNESYFLFYLPV